MKRSALLILGELDNGLVMADLTEQLYNAHQQAAATQRPAKVQLTLTIKPALGKTGTPGVNNADVLTIVAAIDTKLPKPAHDPTLFFVNGDGNISRNQDRQQVIPGVRSVGDPTGTEFTAPSTNPAAAG